jgi:sulfate adenylyltransferase
MSLDPHGGTLIRRLATPEEARIWLDKAPSLPAVLINERQIADLEMISVGALSPLTGFMGREDYRSVVMDMHLANGLPWSIPITLAVSTEEAARLREGDAVALYGQYLQNGGENGEEGRRPVLGILFLREKFPYDKRLEARKVYLTEDEAHPGVAALYRQGDVLLGGDVLVLAPIPHDDFLPYRLTPEESRARFKALGWQTIVGFQTRNPVHRAHEYIQKCALEIVDGLFLHPLIGQTKDDDIPAATRMLCYEILIETYYPRNRVVLGVNPAAMRYAGPREAIFHAIIRKNYGCTHFIVGRDHAGVGNYYGTYDAQRIFREFDPRLLGITPLFFEHAFYCRACMSMASSKTCPHGDEWHVTLSGTKVRAMLQAGEAPPPEFSRPEVAAVLIAAARRQSAIGV